MKFQTFKKTKSLSLANALYISNKEIANALSECEYRYISCIKDEVLGDSGFIKCEISSISYVLAMICKYRGASSSYFDELDEGHLSGECNVGEEEFEELNEWLDDETQLIVDSSVLRHKDSKNILKFLEILNLSVVMADSNVSEVDTTHELSELDELESFDGSVVYQVRSDEKFIKGGVSFATVSKIKDNDEIVIEADGFKYAGKFKLDESNRSTIAFVGVSEIAGYDFRLVKVSKA